MQPPRLKDMATGGPRGNTDDTSRVDTRLPGTDIRAPVRGAPVAAARNRQAFVS